MKKFAMVFCFIILTTINVWANGVAIVDDTEGIYLRLLSAEVEITVENQVAIVTAIQVFHNDLGQEEQITYGFPMHEGASAIELLWSVGGTWFEANFAAIPQDSTPPGPGDDPDPDLINHMGPMPLYFDVAQPVQADSILIVQLTYVELLPYEFGNVEFHFPNNYQLIQDEPLDFQQLFFHLYSQRTIDNILLLSHTPTAVYNDGNEAYVEYFAYETFSVDYQVQYTLSPEELGLFSFSTYLPDSLVPDDHGFGFFVFVAEPDPGETVDAIDKVFTLMIDRSGSMSGDKIIQARDASSFIVQNLNEGDRFNLVSFNDQISSFQPDHIEFTPQSEADALAYIAQLTATGSTNISGAFSTAVPQFDAADEGTANIIIFFTDGRPTAGITATQQLLAHIENLVLQSETEITIFTFGIGGDVNTQLLTLLAAQHNGLAEFLGDEELESVITDFYLRIRNPVLLNTEMEFSSPTISETYPSPLPSLYKGQQLIVAGRYGEPVPVTVTFSGMAYGQPISYIYDLELADSNQESYRFLTKIWAKLKIEHLLVEYFSYGEGTPEAEAIRELIIEISLAYGVLSPFTNFSGGDPIATEDEQEFREDSDNEIAAVELLGNYPNPFNPSTTIRFRLNLDLHQFVFVKIYNVTGQVVRVLAVKVDGPGDYEVMWDGKTIENIVAATGTYFYIIDFGRGLVSGKMTLLK
ncbi:MAG: VWA domain-containing protein [Planctomycetes bacterium]|nr:VWA domain-containing protein [Planctomycetota bacterium]